MPAEFDIIRRLFASAGNRDEVLSGIGDDAAIIEVPDGYQLVVSTDTLNAGVHFPDDCLPEDIGYKALAVNLSDIASMGAEPFAVNLSLSLPSSDEDWIERFARGFSELMDSVNVQLTGGDTTRGPLSISVTIMGILPRGSALKRSGARPGDAIYVTGTLGDAGAALLGLLGELKLNGPQKDYLNRRLNRPQPRLAMGEQLQGLATACIDISDGLSSDLSHILAQSNVGATIYVDQLPLSDSMQEVFDLSGGWAVPLNSGDDYELCFTVPADKQAALESRRQEFDCRLTCIGMVEAGQGLRLQMPDGSIEQVEASGYEHFT